MRISELQDDLLPAFDTQVMENSVRVYMQTGVLAGEGDPGEFRKAVEAFRSRFRLRPRKSESVAGRLIELNEDEAAITDGLQHAAGVYLKQLDYPSDSFPGLFCDYGWKMRNLPERRNRILSVGCGGGAELVFLRANYPDAEITALDYELSSSRSRRSVDLLSVEFLQGDIFESMRDLRSHGRRFDLIFSNHVIEHFYEPDQAIATMAGVLEEGGMFSSALPLDAYPMADLLRAIAENPGRTHPLDINWLDLRHPWKTNEADLAATLIGAGLKDVTLYRRSDHANNTKCAFGLSMENCRRRESRARTVYGLFLRPPIGLLKAVFGAKTPRRLARLVFAVDRRLWFGRYKLKCDIQPEVFVTATRASA